MESIRVCGKLLKITTDSNPIIFVKHVNRPELMHRLVQTSNASGVSGSEPRCQNGKMGVSNKVTFVNLHLPMTLLRT